MDKPETLPIDDRFWARIEKEGHGDCWVWIGATSHNGYPAFRLGVGGKIGNARRYAYEQLRGPIPDGHVLKDSCHNRRCVNPEHFLPQRRNAEKSNRTLCPRGHEFSPENTFIEADGSRRCRRCRADRALLRSRVDSVKAKRAERDAEPAVRKRIREKMREWRAGDPERNANYQRKIKRKRREWLDEYRTARGCQRCGEKHPGCLEFHHQGSKDFPIANAFSAGLSKEKLLAEFDKCEVLCANCHRKHHYDERKKSSKDVTHGIT